MEDNGKIDLMEILVWRNGLDWTDSEGVRERFYGFLDPVKVRYPSE
jgi:hypothetical protein